MEATCQPNIFKLSDMKGDLIRMFRDGFLSEFDLIYKYEVDRDFVEYLLPKFRKYQHAERSGRLIDGFKFELIED